MTFVAAVCPQCAGALQAPNDRDYVKCMYCGVDVKVREAIRLVQGNTGNLLELAEAAQAGGNNVEAISYFNKVLENDPRNAKAWFGKGRAAGWLSTLNEFRFAEVFVSFENAIKYSDEGSVAAMRQAAAVSIAHVATACYEMARKHLLEFAPEKTWAEHIPRCRQIIAAYEVAHAYAPGEQAIIKNIVEVCKGNIEGVSFEDPYELDVSKRIKVHFLSDAYESEIRSLMTKYAEQLKSLDPAYKAPDASRPKKDDGCFVVTATLGDPNHPTVLLLRWFRDRHLRQTRVGQCFVDWYYLHGPRFAKTIEGSPIAQKLSYLVVVSPAAALARIVYRLQSRQQ